MADTLLRVLLIFLIAGMLTARVSKAVRLSVNPDKCIATLETSVQISCVPEDIGDKGTQITMMEISRNNEDPIVFLRDCSNITYRSDNTAHRFQAEGYIDSGFQKSFLNLTLLSPMSEDTGIYTCVMYYVDPVGRMKQETSSWNLNVEKIDVKSLELRLTQLSNKISTLEMDGKKQASMLVMKVDELEDNTAQQVKELSDKVNYNTAFTVSTAGGMTSKGGHVLILPQVITQQGQGYDVKTGIFTSPRDGLYVFHVVLFAERSIYMDLMKNQEVIAKIYVYDKNNKEWNQSAVSSVVPLKAGDQVKIVQRTNGVNLHGGPFNLFTGYLIKAF